MITDIYMPVLPAILPLLIIQNGYSYLAAGLLVTAYNITSSSAPSSSHSWEWRKTTT
jgi:FSR family fosmidomycin resistance protein-like MFS transporter